ncbi:MAG: NAD(P)/FAD-dependent oxidoreductase [Bacteroidetes bacterium]|nr:NAD(P)/FAD-dependent oxidoreductase [Bacteroidota bacterium]
MPSAHTLIIGAGPSGLACAATLRREGIDYTIIESQARVAPAWHHHYERLHLHTSKGLSHLPYKKFGSSIPRYPSRTDVIDYMEDYCRDFGIQPLFNTTAASIQKEGEHWVTQTNNGSFSSRYLIMATGPFSRPRPIRLPGMDSFPGPLLHSYEYKSGRDFRGQQVLVTGFGNSACEIAIDLHEQGAIPSMAVRSAVNVVPRDILGIPIPAISIALSWLPPRLADAISAPLVKAITGDITRLGLRRKQYGPLQQIRLEGKAPVLDIGTLRLIREGHIEIYGDIKQIEGKTVYFKDGQEQDFDAIIAAIGYEQVNSELLRIDPSRFQDLRRPIRLQKYFGADGLYFCGFWISPTGQLRENASDALKIARHIAGR